ncbi:glycosyltransferase family 4 protein [Candidatus Nomurabacteria bacterium]|nr:glycosyltransferase family 4 protein [Candidatus Nomurabacteria bacterium]
MVNKFDYTLGIDASNLRDGGGLGHISQILNTVDPQEFGINQVLIWAGKKTLDNLPIRKWLKKKHVPTLDKTLPYRILWRQCELLNNIRKTNCNALFAPGGLIPNGSTVPTITMSQNLLPFVKKEIQRFPLLSLDRLRFVLLRYGQMSSMKRANGIIFLTQYAQNVVLKELKTYTGLHTIIPHGIEKRFFSSSFKKNKPLSDYSISNPFKLLYVSTVYYYKHQWQVAKAVTNLRDRGFPVVIDFIGNGHPVAKNMLNKTIKNLDPKGAFLRYNEGVPFEKINSVYQTADAFVFASSCETFGSVLLEAMAAGLPVASTRGGAMSEILGDSAVYFDPEKIKDIEIALETLLKDLNLRELLAKATFEKAKQYSWEQCSKETFSFISNTINGCT